MVIDATSEALEASAHDIQQWSDRRKGIGFDQLLVLESPLTVKHDLRMQIFNGDGGTATQCGNGCAAATVLANDIGLVKKDDVALDTLGGTVSCQRWDDVNPQVTVELPPPVLQPESVPFLTDIQGYQHQIELPSPINRCIHATVLSMGNPHAVIFVDNIKTIDLATLGRSLQQHSQFPESVNVEILQCIDRSHARLRICERGVGETLSCGSGACASMVAGRLLNRLDSKAKIETRGGSVYVEWKDPASPVRMSCQPQYVYQGSLLQN